MSKASEAEATTIQCRECGETEEPGRWVESTRERLTRESLCFSCDHWAGVLRLRDRADIARIEGVHYIIEPDKPAGYRGFVGYGGRRFDITFHDGRRVTTRNLWCQGSIPPRYRDRLPDNATFADPPAGEEA